MVRVKLQLGLADGAEKVVWRHPEDSKYSDLIDFIADAFDGLSESDYQIQYKDDEGDLITCSSESDIDDALNFAEEEGLRSLKLFVITSDDTMDGGHSDNDDGVEVVDLNDVDDDDRGMLDQRELMPAANAEEEDDPDDEEDDEDHGVEDESPLVHSEEHDEDDDDDDDDEEEEEEIETFHPDDLVLADDREEEEEQNALETFTESQPVQYQKEVEVVERKEANSIPSMRDILCSVHHEIRQNKATATDLVVTICSNWPLNASYPMHLGAMLQMMIEDENKKELYGFIVEHEHYPILQSALKQYAGTELQGHIKQMANLCRTVGAEKFCSLSINILDAIKTVLEGGAFELDFAPLLMATTPKQKKPTPQPTSPMTLKQSGKGDESASVRSFSAKATPATRQAKSGKSSARKKVKKTVTKKPVISKSKGRAKPAKSAKPKPRAKPKRVLFTHGAYISCNECDACPIRGARFVSMLRENYNLCEECEAKLMEAGKLQDPMIKIYRPRSNWHIKHFKGLQDLVAIPDLNDSDPRDESASQSSQVNANGPSKTNAPSSNPPFKFLSKEMQEKYVNSLKEQEEEEVAEATVLPADSVSQTHSQSQRPESQKLEQLNQIPLHSIMPTAPKPMQQQNSAIKKNESLMSEIDALLKPSSEKPKKQQSRNNTSAMNTSMASGGLDALAFGSSGISSYGGNAMGGNDTMNASAMSFTTPSGGGDELSGLIDLVNSGAGSGSGSGVGSRGQNTASMNSAANNSFGAFGGNNGNDRRGGGDSGNGWAAEVESTEHPGDIATNASATLSWRIKNTGFKPFGNRCKLSFVAGDGLLVSQYHIPNANPGETVKVSMSFNAFSTPGTYETNFRLSSDGQQFGPQLIVKINVLDPANLMPKPSVHPIQNQAPPRNSYPPQQPVAVQQQPPTYWGQQQQPVQQQPVQPNYCPPAPRLQPQEWRQATVPQANYYQPPPQQIQAQPQPQVQPRPQSQPKPQVQVAPEPDPEPEPVRHSTPPPSRSDDYYRSGPRFKEPTSLFDVDDEPETKENGKDKKGWFGWGKKKEAVKKESNLKCLCGATLMYLDVKQAYKGKKVYCDICSQVCKQCIFHCPAGDIKSHPGGFDLCYACGGSQLAKQPNPSPTEMLLTTDSGLAYGASSDAMAYPALKPSAPPAPSPNKSSSSKSSSKDSYDPNFVYASQLQQLLDMGFEREKARRLLLKNKGNMSQVLAQLIK